MCQTSHDGHEKEGPAPGTDKMRNLVRIEQRAGRQDQDGLWEQRKEIRKGTNERAQDRHMEEAQQACKILCNIPFAQMPMQHLK